MPKCIFDALVKFAHFPQHPEKIYKINTKLINTHIIEFFADYNINLIFGVDSSLKCEINWDLEFEIELKNIVIEVRPKGGVQFNLERESWATKECDGDGRDKLMKWKKKSSLQTCYLILLFVCFVSVNKNINSHKIIFRHSIQISCKTF